MTTLSEKERQTGQDVIGMLTASSDRSLPLIPEEIRMDPERLLWALVAALAIASEAVNKVAMLQGETRADVLGRFGLAFA